MTDTRAELRPLITSMISMHQELLGGTGIILDYSTACPAPFIEVFSWTRRASGDLRQPASMSDEYMAVSVDKIGRAHV